MKNKEKLVGTLSDDSDDNAVKVEDTKLVIKKKFLSDKKRKRPSSDEYENPGFYAALDQGIEIRNELKFFNSVSFLYSNDSLAKIVIIIFSSSRQERLKRRIMTEKGLLGDLGKSHVGRVRLII